MTMTIKQFNRFCLLTCAPFIGLFIWLLYSNMSISLPGTAYPKDAAAVPAITKQTGQLLGDLDLAKKTATATAQTLKKSIALYQATNASMNSIAKTASAQVGRPAKIYDRRITRKIGTPMQTIQSDNLQAQLFAVHAQNFSGYALKVKLKTDKGMKMVL
ncbi:phosphodiester glycosidase family protein, partial [Paenibacillus sepulcri]|nr:phosphodiester glycosidase family protein [Paenibacillus sepulcri]